ncbi:hypothetical protein IAU59_000571 [Kwoniella sp. CBS 9459]
MSPPPPTIPLPHILASQALQREQDALAASQSRAAGRREMKASVLRTLTMTQNTSAMVFSVFMVAHLASPVVAVFAGMSGADKTMMIARDLYLPLEPVLVWAPLSIHLVSSLSRRLITMSSAFSSTSSSSSTSTASPDPSSDALIPTPSKATTTWRDTLRALRFRLPRQAHQILAYPLSFLLLSHVLTHRLVPMSTRPPISSLSPSELGWEFVGHNLQSAVSWVAYLGLVGAGVWHAAVGSMKIVSWLKSRRAAKAPTVVDSRGEATQTPSVNGEGSVSEANKTSAKKPTELTSTARPRPVISRRRKIGLRGIIVLFLGTISIGLYRVRSDTGLVSAVMKRRYDAVFARVPWAVLWLH